MPWQQHPTAFLKGLRQGRASLSSFLGFSGSGSDLSEKSAEDEDRATACSRRTSCSPAAGRGVSGEENPHGKRITEDFRGEGGNGGRRGESGGRKVRESMDDSQSDNSGADVSTEDSCDGTATAAAGSLAMLTIGEISFEVGWKHRSRSRRRVVLLAWNPPFFGASRNQLASVLRTSVLRTRLAPAERFSLRSIFASR